MPPPAACALCGHPAPALRHRTPDREWWQCAVCDLTFVPGEYHLIADEEKARYDTHQNVVGDPDYCSFLDRLCQPLMKHLAAGAMGLDFGSGPGPALADMMIRRGYDMALYDLYFAPDEKALNVSYDFVTCTETVEHFRAPASYWARLVSLIKPGGHLGIMTQTAPQNESFAEWYYIRDPTHVAFYTSGTFKWLAGHHHLDLIETAPNIAIFMK